MDLLEMVRAALRLSTRVFDDLEITPLIEASKIDLYLGGVNFIDTGDPLIQRAVVLYCKAYFGQTDESDRNARAYEALKISLASSGRYGQGAGGGDRVDAGDAGH